MQLGLCVKKNTENYAELSEDYISSAAHEGPGSSLREQTGSVAAELPLCLRSPRWHATACVL